MEAGKLISLTLGVLFIGCCVSQPLLPTYFVANVNKSYPYVSYTLSQTLLWDEDRGARANNYYLLSDGTSLFESSYYPIDSDQHFTIYEEVLGYRAEPPLCFAEPRTAIDYPPFNNPDFITHITDAMVNGDKTEVWYPIADTDCCPPHWWYILKTNFGTYYPDAWAGIDGDLSLITQFSLEHPSARDYDLPDCYPIHQSVMKRDVEAAPRPPTWPDSFSITVNILGGYLESLFVDGTKQWFSIQHIQTNVPDYPKYISHMTYFNNNNTLYTIVEWLNISPRPCIYEVPPVSPDIWKTPQFTRLGSIKLFQQDQQVDTGEIYASGPNRDTVWLYGNMSTPIAYFLPLEGVGIAAIDLAIVDIWQPGTPDPNSFSTSSLCFPRYNTTMMLPKGSSGVGAPTLPSAFTIFLIGFEGVPTVTKRTIYFDGTKSFVRFDDNGYTVLQRGNDVYRFARDLNNTLNPAPCEHYTASALMWIPPSFVRRVANVTMDGKITQVWVAPDRIITNHLQYWYFDSMGIPQLIMDGTFIASKVQYFQPTPPPSGVFDVPAFCFTLFSEEKKQQQAWRISSSIRF